MNMLYDDDVFQVFTEYKKRVSYFNPSKKLIQIDYVKHYCKKFNLNYRNYRKQLEDIYKRWILLDKEG